MKSTFDPGTYRCRVTRWMLMKAKTGTPQFALSFTPLGKFNAQNANDDRLEACPDFERTIFRPITEKTAQWLLQDLKTLFEYPHDQFLQLDPESPDAFDLTDREFTAILQYEEYDGKTRERWNFATGQPMLGDPMTPSEVRKLDVLFGSAKPRRRSKKEESPPAAAAAPPAVPAGAPEHPPY
jgi:hypothetical protein